MNGQIIEPGVAIGSMRDSGFSSAAHALAEIIDNSIQASSDRVELIAFETPTAIANNRVVKRLERIGILDNGCGMSPETLQLSLRFGASENRKDKNGIGKFGMGLPNSSISQCKRVDVWSWTKEGECHHTYLDIEEIESGTQKQIPYPEAVALPDDVFAVCKDALAVSGTFVLWSKIDRCQWKTGKSIYKHTQRIVGRMYRNFLHKNKVAIRYKSVELKDGLYVLSDEQLFLPNDPNYLMKDSSLPELPGVFKGESMFELVDGCKHTIRTIIDENGIEQPVYITGTVLKKPVLNAMKKVDNRSAGHSVWGKDALSNYGLSVVRAGRELALLPEFYRVESGQRGWGRWYSIQIEFDPSLDNLFGVTNNKQQVVNFRMMDRSEEAEKVGYETEQQYIVELTENKDPKAQIFKIIDEIKTVESILIDRIKTYSFKDLESENTVEENTASNTAKKIDRAEKNREEKCQTEKKPITRAELEETLRGGGVEDPNSAIETILDNNLQVWVETKPLQTDAFFDVATKRGFTLLQINSNHIFTTSILDKLPAETREALEICLGGWARMEKECTSEMRLLQLQMARKDWGLLLSSYLPQEGDDSI